MIAVGLGVTRLGGGGGAPVPVDITGLGTAIGTSDGVGLPANAFDNNSGTNFRSQHTDTGISGVDYIGMDFGSSLKNVRRITIQQGGTDARNQQTSVKWQYSDDASVWTDIATLTLAQNTTVQSFDVPGGGFRRAYRILANSAPSSSGGWIWFVSEIEMFEP